MNVQHRTSNIEVKRKNVREDRAEPRRSEGIVYREDAKDAKERGGRDELEVIC